MLDLLDSLIATVTVVLVLSLIVQSIQQIIKQLFNMKSKFMERELFAMFADVKYKRSIVPVKYQFAKLAERRPEIKNFVRKIATMMNGIGYDDLSLVESLSKDEFLKVTGSLLDTGELEVQEKDSKSTDEKVRLNEEIDFRQKARSHIEQWYDTTLRAFQDHYERRMKMWAFGLSAIVVLWLNQNIFEVYDDFSHDEVLTATVVKMGEKLLEGKADTTTTEDPSGTMVRTVSVHVPPIDTIQAELAKIRSLESTDSFTLMRWDKAPALPGNSASLGDYAAWVWQVLLHNFFGWLAMTLLVALGAPFWYDLLKTLMGVKDKIRGQTSASKANGNAAAAGVPTPANLTGPPAQG